MKENKIEAKHEDAFKKLEELYFGDNKHESREIERLPELLDGVKCFVDIGASLGQYSYFASKAMKGAQFYLVEADPFKAERLREMTQKWSEETGNEFDIIERAASDSEGSISFYIPKSHLSSGALFPLTEDKDDWEKVTAVAEPIDKLLKGVEVDFMKLDVEGAEYRALLGAKDVLTRCDVKLLLEIAPWGDIQESHKPSDVLKLLASYGYDFEIFENHYLFHKGGGGIKRWAKSRSLGFVLDHPKLKQKVKNIFNRFRKG